MIFYFLSLIHTYSHSITYLAFFILFTFPLHTWSVFSPSSPVHLHTPAQLLTGPFSSTYPHLTWPYPFSRPLSTPPYTYLTYLLPLRLSTFSHTCTAPHLFSLFSTTGRRGSKLMMFSSSGLKLLTSRLPVPPLAPLILLLPSSPLIYVVFFFILLSVVGFSGSEVVFVGLWWLRGVL